MGVTVTAPVASPKQVGSVTEKLRINWAEAIAKLAVVKMAVNTARRFIFIVAVWCKLVRMRFDLQSEKTFIQIPRAAVNTTDQGNNYQLAAGAKPAAVVFLREIFQRGEGQRTKRVGRRRLRI
jgi:hypothetical protein